MESNESWWRKSAEVADQPRSEPVPAPAGQPQADEPVDFEADVEGNSIGEQIDSAIGDFDAKILRLKEELQEKRTDIKELEIRIADLEKAQVKAFKSLLSANPQIKRMLSAKPKKSATTRKKKADKPRSEDADTETLL